jgi:hypothetical protein
MTTINSLLPSSGAGYKWNFFRAGGVDQVLLRNGEDILNLDSLDQKLWVALACPVRGIEFDTKTLDYLDTDKDGRIRAPEIIGAIKWIKEVFANPNDLLKGGDTVPLAAINQQTAAGAALLAGAKRILTNLDKPDSAAIGLEDVADTAKIFAATKFNGDGIVPAESAPDENTKNVIADIIATHGGLPDRSGKVGINQAKADAFFAESQAFSEWMGKSEVDRAILPLGGNTAEASAALKKIKAKLEDYFARCRLSEFDPRAAAPLNRAEAEFVALAVKDMTVGMNEIAQLPLARVEPNRPLPLNEGINPAWRGAMTDFVSKVVYPLLGKGKATLDEAEWNSLQAQLAPFEAWMATKPATLAEKLGLARVRAILGSPARGKVNELIKTDAALEAEVGQLAAVEKLILFQRDFFRLLNNYVNFSEFYSRKGAVFQAGTLYLDGRSCNLCVPVADAGKHASLAGLAAAYLAYCDCTRSGGEKMTIAAAFTDGDSDNLIVGRNGVFYDRKGRDWDATITKIIPNPISIREAFWSPYKKLVRMIEEQVAKRAAAADAAANEKLAGAATAVATADKTKAPPPPTPKAEAKKTDVGTVAAIGVALGSLATFLGLMVGKFFDLGVYMPVGILAIILMISGPSMLLAYLKLRQRNLGPILDANGWAINGRARINVPFGGALTDVASLPPGSQRTLSDPYAEKKRPWKFYIAVAVIIVLGVLWYIGKLDAYLPNTIRSTTALGKYAPAYKADKAAPGENKAPEAPAVSTNKTATP